MPKYPYKLFSFSAQSAAPPWYTEVSLLLGRGDGVGSLALSPREDIVARHLKVAQGQLHSPVAERALIELVDARAVVAVVVGVLQKLLRHAEAKSFLSKHVPLAQRVAGPDHELTLRLRGRLADAILLVSNRKFGGKIGARDYREALSLIHI